MKIIFKISAVLIFVFMQFTSEAQNNKDSLASMLENKSFVFIPYSASPMRGRNIQLTSGFDFQMRNDSISTYLPYYGRSSVAPIPTEPGGIQMETKKFSYAISSGKKSRKYVEIKVEDQVNFNKFTFTVFSNGDATLTVNSNYSDPISFNGIILALRPIKPDDNN